MSHSIEFNDAPWTLNGTGKSARECGPNYEWCVTSQSGDNHRTLIPIPLASVPTATPGEAHQQFMKNNADLFPPKGRSPSKKQLMLKTFLASVNAKTPFLPGLVTQGGAPMNDGEVATLSQKVLSGEVPMELKAHYNKTLFTVSFDTQDTLSVEFSQTMGIYEFNNAPYSIAEEKEFAPIRVTSRLRLSLNDDGTLKLVFVQPPSMSLENPAEIEGVDAWGINGIKQQEIFSKFRAKCIAMHIQATHAGQAGITDLSAEPLFSAQQMQSPERQALVRQITPNMQADAFEEKRKTVRQERHEMFMRNMWLLGGGLLTGLVITTILGAGIADMSAAFAAAGPWIGLVGVVALLGIFIGKVVATRNELGAIDQQMNLHIAKMPLEDLMAAPTPTARPANTLGLGAKAKEPYPLLGVQASPAEQQRLLAASSSDDERDMEDNTVLTNANGLRHRQGRGDASQHVDGTSSVRLGGGGSKSV